ncbi:Protein MOR1 [Camellia lanceoleosa]|nr:Protein MOR1 [Camellia lanceoleosa]
MGLAVEKSSKVVCSKPKFSSNRILLSFKFDFNIGKLFLASILSDVLKCLGDNKKHMRESTLTTLDAWLAAVHLDKMVPYITLALMDLSLVRKGAMIF